MTITVVPQPTAPVAAGFAFLIALLSRVYFSVADNAAGSAILLPAFPFVTGGLGIVALRYALRAWRATRTAEQPSGGQAFRLALVLLAILTDIGVIGFAAFIGLMILNGPMVR